MQSFFFSFVSSSYWYLHVYLIVNALNPEEADTLVMKWVDQLLSRASHILEKYYILEFSEANKGGSFFTPLSRMARKQPGCYHNPSRQFIQLDLWLLLFVHLLMLIPLL